MKTYTDKTRYLFVQLRARGISLGTISKELDVPKSTVGDWDKSFSVEIARLRAIEWEAVEDQFGRTLEKDLRALAERILRWEAAIDRLNPGHCRVRDMLAVLRDTRREYFRRRAILMAPLEDTLTHAVSRSLHRRPDEAGRYTFLPPVPLHNTNDLQQSPTQPSGDVAAGVPPASAPGVSPGPVSVTPEVTRAPISPHPHANNNGYPADAAHENSPHVDAKTTDVKINQRTPTAIPSPGGEGKGEGDSVVTSTVDPLHPHN